MKRRRPAKKAASTPRRPNRVWKFLSCWQELWAGLIALGVFIAAPYAIEYFFPEDGALRPGSYVHTFSLGVAFFFSGLCLSWAGVHFSLRAFDDMIDAGWLRVWFADLTRDPTVRTTHKICLLLAPFFALLLWFAVSLWLAVSLVK